MNDRLTLTHQQLYTYSVCPRRFYLRYLARVPWPEAPLGVEQELAYERGRRFHRWVERHLLGLQASSAASADPVVGAWWSIFQTSAPPLPDGERFAEAALTVPIGPHFLTGRFDLLVLSAPGDEALRAALFDWKTGEPRPPARLRDAWQTRVYLAIVAQGGGALLGRAAPAVEPGRISMTYWYVAEPDRPRRIDYDAAWHDRNWAELEAMVVEIDGRLARDDWPKIEDGPECRRCAYQAHCGRHGSPAEAEMPDEDEAADEDSWLEPEWG